MKGNYTKLVFIFCALTSAVFAGEKKYPYHTIPEHLLKDANAVVRNYEIILTVSSIKKHTIKYKRAITILNQNADKRAMLSVFYDTHNKINYIKGAKYDMVGNEIAKLKKGDIEDQSAVSDFSIYEDDRIKTARLTHRDYPYTVEFEYEVTYTASLFYPTWAPITGEKTSLEKSRFEVTSPSELPVRYKEVNLPGKVKKSSQNGIDKLEWEIKNLQAIKWEPYGPYYSEIVPKVSTAPTYFEMDGYKGKMNSWDSFGEWINIINNGRDDLPSSVKAKVKELIRGKNTTEEKTKALYKYLQEKTRYVSIQLGIGGWQPFEASFVDKQGYGDCKALTNYTKALLKEAGINSYYTLVRAGEDVSEISSDFPNVQFNHAFLCVPNNQDTIWLECTSQTNPFGYLGTFTSDRNVLLITEDGGKLVHTPSYSHQQNLQASNMEVFLDKSGNATASITTRYQGVNYDNDNFPYYYRKGKEDQKKWLYQKLDVSGLVIEEFNLSIEGDQLPVAKETLKIKISKLASANGKRIFLQPNILNKWSGYPKKVDDRKTEVVRDYAYMDSDTIQFHLPDGYHIEFKPEIVNHKSRFGEYSAVIEASEGEIKYIRTLKMNKGRFPAEAYEEFRDFIKKVVKADQSKIVLVSST